jgi:ubiquinone/menaquinone biosynthesis C-methylase UbiE
LICGCAEALPFPDVRFGAVAFDSTLEVVSDAKNALSEAQRVMQPGGYLFILTPNRYSLGPDPHMKLWAGGYLPDRWISAYARRQKAIPPKRKLRSARSIHRLLRESGFEVTDLSVPGIGEQQRKQLGGVLQSAVSLYNICKNWFFFGTIFRWIGPLLQVVARKPSGTGESDRELQQ